MKILKWITQVFKFIFYLWSAPFVLLFGSSLMKNQYISYLTKGKKGVIVKLGLIFGFMSVIWLFVVSTPTVTGTAMEPTLLNGEIVVLNKIAYEINDPQRGDIVIFKFPKNQELDYISRIIAIAEDTIQLKDGAVYLNGTLLQESYIKGITLPSTEEGGIKEGEVFTVPEDSFFVMADNRLHSVDSRNFGPVSKSNLIGNVAFRYWPFERFGLIASYKNSSTVQTGDDLYSIGLYFLKQKNIAKAEEYFTKAGIEYKHVLSINELGFIYFEKKDYLKARDFFQSALEIEPDNAYALHNIGYAYWNMSDRKKAEEYLKRASAAYEKANNPELKDVLENLRTFLKENNIKL